VNVVVKTGATTSLIFIFILFGIGVSTLVYALVLEASIGGPVYVVLAAFGTLLAVVATFISIIQQKIEKL